MLADETTPAPTSCLQLLASLETFLAWDVPWVLQVGSSFLGQQLGAEERGWYTGSATHTGRMCVATLSRRPWSCTNKMTKSSTPEERDKWFNKYIDVSLPLFIVMCLHHHGGPGAARHPGAPGAAAPRSCRACSCCRRRNSLYASADRCCFACAPVGVVPADVDGPCAASAAVRPALHLPVPAGTVHSRVTAHMPRSWLPPPCLQAVGHPLFKVISEYPALVPDRPIELSHRSAHQRRPKPP